MSRRFPKVFVYHAVGRMAEDPNHLCTSPERLEEHMRNLKRRGFRGVSMRGLRAANGAEGLVGLTFDDGYKDFLHEAVPILESFGFSATVFVIGGLLGKTNDWEHHVPQPEMRLLSAEETREVARRGMEVGAHTMTHVRLAGLPPEHLEEEVRGSREILEEVIGEEVEGFCYPFGSIDENAVRAARRAGYEYACAVSETVEKSAYDIPRIPLAERDNAFRFSLKMRIYPQYLTAKRLFSSEEKS